MKDATMRNNRDARKRIAYLFVKFYNAESKD